MMLFVATTGPPFCAICGVGGTSVPELVMDDNEVDEDEVKAVEPESCEDREVWLMVWLRVGRPLPALLEEKTGAVLVLARGPWA
jgi:hypothetical protein